MRHHLGDDAEKVAGIFGYAPTNKDYSLSQVFRSHAKDYLSELGQKEPLKHIESAVLNMGKRVTVHIRNKEKALLDLPLRLPPVLEKQKNRKSMKVSGRVASVRLAPGTCGGLHHEIAILLGDLGPILRISDLSDVVGSAACENNISVSTARKPSCTRNLVDARVKKAPEGLEILSRTGHIGFHRYTNSSVRPVSYRFRS